MPLVSWKSNAVLRALYQTASEVVRDGLRLLRDREVQRDELRREIALGLDQVRQGKVKPFDETTLSRVKARGRSKRGKQAS